VSLQIPSKCSTEDRLPLAVKTSCAGYGAYYTGPTTLPTGSFVSLYAGEYLTTEEARARWRGKHDDNYILSIRLPDQTIHIDPRYHGNFGRFLNHSCDPNCVIHVVRWGGGVTWPRAAIFVCVCPFGTPIQA
jgi:histone-lysine N-methyltransferase SETMAR